MGITNCCANIMSIIAPLVVGLIVKDEVTDDGEHLANKLNDFKIFRLIPINGE